MKQEEKDRIIERQLRFQDLLISISTKYINSDLSDIDTIINASLKKIGQFVGSDRSYIFSYDFNTNTTSNTYEWCAEGVSSEMHNLQNVPIDYIPQWLEAHKKGEAFYIENVSLLPKDGPHGLRGILEPQGVKSLLAIPKFKNNQLIGFVGFDAVKTLKPYTENEKNILFVFANMLVNVMQRKEHEDQIKAQEKKKEELLIHLSRQNEQLNEYAHAVSHDLKAPLVSIHTLITWFMDDKKAQLNKTDLEQLNLVLFNVEKMDFLIEGILDYSTIDRLETPDTKINTNAIVNEIVKTLLIPRHIQIKIQENLPNIYANTWRIKQVFQNLIHNALKYSDKEKGIIEIGCVEKKDHYEFFVKDNGIGIHAQYFDKIFKVFTKLESKSTSSGIGLSIVKKIITYYQGEIWLESQEGVGTTFYFTFLKNNQLPSVPNKL
ncbi:ATP-binding protein [Bizionia sediminis]|uniref:histidine kinase n=1 Tax=Bizionia sediminis TaxID=1737064 RepID=A0ABW5KS68_9FLAO